ncbi:CBS domain-containing protein [Bacillus marinisedimentorum]|uniref:CBS domain-containing protein n=1 Tax=Bacillus marinisedimentorum TaxID=1821260 RepID=UPI000872134D|nr:CBS domain-containing protein [Bacillus marinisedimentorum]
MFVKSVMKDKEKCYTAHLGDSLENALAKLEDYAIDGLPVLDGEKFIGVLTRYQIYRHYFEGSQTKGDYLKNVKVEEIVREGLKVDKEEVFERTLILLKDAPLVAVVDDEDNFLGIVTRADGLVQFESAFGVNTPGIRIALTSVETEGRIKRLADIVRQFHENIISLATFDETDKLVRRIVLKVEKKDNLDGFIKKLEQSGFRILDIKEL